MPWVYNEDGAIKLKLQGLTVQDANAPTSGRRVPVRFRLPEDELSTLSYPIIILEHLPISFAPERQSRGYTQIPYAPEGAQYPIWWDADANSFDPAQSPYWGYWPLAYNLDYQVTIYCRKMVEHLQPLLAKLALQPYLPAQFGFLDIPQDGTIRNMFLMEGPVIEYGKDQDDKRLLRASYMIRVMSEVIPFVSTNGEYGSLVSDINIDLGLYNSTDDVTIADLTASTSIISTGPNIGFNVGYLSPPIQPPGRVKPESTRMPPRRIHERGVWR